MIYIGIDPGVHTGFAAWDTEYKMFRCIATLGILDAMFTVKLMREQFETPAVIVFEDARKRQWLPRERNMSEYRGKLMGAGSIKRDCEIWEEFCRKEGMKFEAIPPRKGATKWTADSFERITGWKGRTSNHARDAALLVFQRTAPVTPSKPTEK